MPKNSRIRPLPTDWKNALRSNFLELVDYDEEEIEGALDEEDTKSEPLSKYRLGPYIIIPTMSDDEQSSVRVLAAVGFIVEKVLEVVVGNCSCETIVLVEDPVYTSERGVLLSCNTYSLHWNVLLS